MPISVSNFYKVKLPKIVSPFTGKLTKELNKRQKYNNFYKKPKLVQKTLPTIKNVSDQL